MKSSEISAYQIGTFNFRNHSIEQRSIGEGI